MTNSCQKTGLVPLWTSLTRYPYTAAAAVLFISQAFPPLLRRRTEWTEVFVSASKDFLAGQNFLAKDYGYVYPPFFAMVSTPFTLLPQALSQILFYLISVACLVYVVKSAWSMSGGGRLQGAGVKVEPGEHLVFLLAILCAGRFLLNALSHLQTDLLIAALVMAGCLALRANRGFVSATWIGLAAAIKCTPLLFAPYLAWRGKWLAALWLVVIAIGVNFLPDMVQRPPSGGSWAVEWYTRYIRPIGQENYVPGTWYTSIINNQSLAGAVKRFFTTTLERTPDGIDVVKKNSDLSPTALKEITLILYAMVTIPSAYALWRRRRMAGAPRAAPDAWALEFSIILLLMLLLSPNSSRGHFGVMLLPAFCVGRIALAGRTRTAWTLFLLATFLSLVCYNTPLNIFFIPTLWAGAVSIVTVLLLAGCIMGLLEGNAHSQ
ncbi:MAG: glycosyltransferase family 87 protein [Syntrophobacteraceae bacterium]